MPKDDNRWIKVQSGFITSVITITSPDTLGTITYDASYEENGFGNFATGTVNTSNSVAVPFEFSPGWGILLVVGGLGLRQLKRKSNSSSVDLT